MSVPFSKTKDPEADLDYIFDWSKWLPAGDTIASADFTGPDGITLHAEEFGNTTATVWISGGVDLENYLVECLIATAGGRTDRRALRLRVRVR